MQAREGRKELDFPHAPTRRNQRMNSSTQHSVLSGQDEWSGPSHLPPRCTAMGVEQANPVPDCLRSKVAANQSLHHARTSVIMRRAALKSMPPANDAHVCSSRREHPANRRTGRPSISLSWTQPHPALGLDLTTPLGSQRHETAYREEDDDGDKTNRD